MKSITTNSLSVTLGDFRKRVFACIVPKGTLIMLNHVNTNKKGNGQIYKVVEKTKQGPFSILRIYPVYGRNQSARYISGERYVYIRKR